MGGITTWYDPEIHGDYTEFLYGRAGLEPGAERTDRHGTVWQVDDWACLASDDGSTHFAVVRARQGQTGGGDFGPWFMGVSELSVLNPAEHGGHTLGVNQRDDSQVPDVRVPKRLFARFEALSPLAALTPEEEQEAGMQEAAVEQALRRGDQQAWSAAYARLNTLDPRRGSRRWRSQVRRQLYGDQNALF